MCQKNIKQKEFAEIGAREKRDEDEKKPYYAIDYAKIEIDYCGEYLRSLFHIEMRQQENSRMINMTSKSSRIILQTLNVTNNQQANNPLKWDIRDLS